MHIRRLAAAAAGLSLLAAALVASPPSAVAAVAQDCYVRPVMPESIVFTHPMEHRAFRIMTNCSLTHVAFKSYRYGTQWDLIRWSGNRFGVVKDGDTTHWSRGYNGRFTDIIPGPFIMPAQYFPIAGRAGYVAKSASVSYQVLQGTRIIKTSVRSTGTDDRHYITGLTEVWENGSWYPEGRSAAVQYRLSNGTWKTVKRFQSIPYVPQSDAPEGYFFVDLPASAPRIYRIINLPDKGNFEAGSTSKAMQCGRSSENTDC